MRSMGDYSTHHTKKITFYISDKNMVYCKTSFQTFYLYSPKKSRNNSIIRAIENGRIKSLEDLAKRCRQDVQWVSTDRRLV